MRDNFPILTVQLSKMPSLKENQIKSGGAILKLSGGTQNQRHLGTLPHCLRVAISEDPQV